LVVEQWHHSIVKRFDFVTWSSLNVHPATASKKRRSINPSVPEWEDSFTLELDAYNKTFCLHMHPNYDLLHVDSQAITTVGLIKRTEGLYGTVRAYRGFVVGIDDHLAPNDAYRCDWTQLEPQYENYGDTHGWARLIVKDQT
jgi:hypothetical protein